MIALLRVGTKMNDGANGMKSAKNHATDVYGEAITDRQKRTRLSRKRDNPEEKGREMVLLC